MKFVIFYITQFDQIGIVKTVICLMIFFASGCHNLKEHSVQSIMEGPASMPLMLDTALFRSTSLVSREAVKKFYTTRNLALFWCNNTMKISAVDSLMTIISIANRYGLIPQDYHLDELNSLVKDSVSEDDILRRDILLTDSYLTIRHHLQHGRLDPKTYDAVDLSAIIDDEGIRSLHGVPEASLQRDLALLQPQGAHYQLLKNALELLLHSADTTRIHLERTRALALNMERWRWEKPLPDRYISVNIPAFLLRILEGDSVWLESKVVVGKRDTPTPVLESVIRSFIIYPYWHVPHSIATKEILPALQADSAYLKKNNFEVLNKKGEVIESSNIPWKIYDAEVFPFILRQREGFENSMGIIKFIFANNYGVYLHDTNSKRLYTRKKRDLSHGCVRVHQAVDLAHYLVREDDIYVSPEDLDQYLSLQQRLKIDLRKPIALKLQYFTCEPINGAVQFYEDIYKKDSLMIQRLYFRDRAHETLADAPL